MRYYLPVAAALLLVTPAAWAQQADTLSTLPPASLLKLGTDACRIGFGSRSVPLYGGLERQLGRRWSWLTDLTATLGLPTRRYPELRLTRLTLQLGARYYYSQGRRQRRGKPTRLFAGTYLQGQHRSAFRGYVSPEYYAPRWTYRYVPGFDVLWGYQRRWGQHGFGDLSAGLSLRWDDQTTADGFQYPDDFAWAFTPTFQARVGWTW